MIVFLDLETTGLRADLHHVLEVAAIVTDDTFAEIGRFAAVVHWGYSQVMLDTSVRGQNIALSQDVNPLVRDMHTANGLWAASAASTMRLSDVDRLLAAFIAETCAAQGVTPGEKNGPQLAGNTINFDRSFLQEDLPLTRALLHYRNIDVTTLNEMARRFWPAVHAGRPAPGKVHRAEADAFESLETARYYARSLTPVTHEFVVGLASGAGAKSGSGGVVINGGVR